MTPPAFLFCLTCVFLGEMAEGNHLKQPTTVRQEKRLIPANVGDDVILKCFYDNDDVKHYWYKQTLGQRLQLISATYTFDKNGTFHDEFKDNPRFALETKGGKNHLKISDVQISDSATYFCASAHSFQLEFGEGTKVDVKGSSLTVKAFLHQSTSESIQLLGSVSCTVHSGIRAGGRTVYWFKNEEEHLPRIIYTHRGRSDNSEQKTNTRICVYNQQMEGMDPYHQCAVASCGHIVFGNRTKLDFQREGNSLVSVYLLSGALTFTTILSVLLAYLLYKMSKRNRSTASQARFSAPATRNTQGYQDEDSLHYAALSIKLPNRPRRQRTNDECVYSGLRL